MADEEIKIERLEKNLVEARGGKHGEARGRKHGKHGVSSSI
jgi:hypothetical protein